VTRVTFCNMLLSYSEGLLAPGRMEVPCQVSTSASSIYSQLASTFRAIRKPGNHRTVKSDDCKNKWLTWKNWFPFGLFYKINLYTEIEVWSGREQFMTVLFRSQPMIQGGCLLDCCAVLTAKRLLKFRRCLLPPLAGQWLQQLIKQPF
jgi:hypothetical protein